MRTIDVDYKNRKKIKNKQPKDSKGSTQDREELGLLRVPTELGRSDEESRNIQQRHNINHALYYLSMLSNSIIQGRNNRWADGAKAERIIDHLSCCQEFLTENDGEVKTAVRILLRNLENQPPYSLNTWARFIDKNWASISILARKYGSKEISFPEENLIKIVDIARSKYFLKIWWWKVRIEKFQMRFKKYIKKVMK